MDNLLIPNISTSNISTSNISTSNIQYDTTTCIICIEPDAISIDDSKIADLINKSCTCHFNVHRKCICSWIIVNPSCPYCKKRLSFSDKCIIIITDDNRPLTNNTHENHIVISTNTGANSSIVDSNNHERESDASCIRIPLIAICLVMAVAAICNFYISFA
jgi:hypothetical protein